MANLPKLSEGLDGHFVDTRDFCEVFWFAPVPTPQEFAARVKALKPEQVAIGVQSFLGADISYVRGPGVIRR